MTSRVYFIKPIGMDGPIKIGYSKCPEKRLVALSMWSPWPLEIIGSVKGIRKDETNFHSRFKDLHSHRKWFRTSPLLLETIAAVLKAGNFSPLLHLPILGRIKNITRRPLTDNERHRMSYTAKVRCMKDRIRKRVGYSGDWRAPDDVEMILLAWRMGKIPSSNEMTRIESYLTHP